MQRIPQARGSLPLRVEGDNAMKDPKVAQFLVG